MNIQAVFFDMGGTIETFHQSREMRLENTPGIQERLKSSGINLPLSNEQLFDVITAGLARYHGWRLTTMEELSPHRIWSEYILQDYSHISEKLAGIAEELMVYLETHYYKREMRSEIPSVLASIREMGLKIGLISNVSSRGQVPLSLMEYSILHYFNPIVLSSDYGRRKPDPAIFHHAARLAGVPTSSCIYIGDRIARDILGARRAGYKLAIQITHDYQHGESDEGALPDRTIGNMGDLLDILRSDIHQKKYPSAGQEDEPHAVQALLFDAGDILYYRPRRGNLMGKFLESLGLVGIQIDEEEKTRIEYQAYTGQISQAQYREALLRMQGITQPEQLETGKQILDEEDNDLEFFDDVEDTLHILKDNGFLLGIVTDTATALHVKIKWLERGGFGDVWDCIICSPEIGARKPDKRIYHVALQQLCIQAHQAVFVGHKSCELAGAKAMGMHTAAFNRDDDATADYYLAQFSDLLRLPIIHLDDFSFTGKC